MTTLLVDGDMLLYRSLIAVEKEIDWGEDKFLLYADKSDGLRNITHFLETAATLLEATSIRIFFSDSTLNFRHAILGTYKAARKATRKPLGYYTLLQAMLFGELPLVIKDIPVKFQVGPGIEADDYIGIVCTHPRSGSECIIVSQDKDFKGIPGKQWRGDIEDGKAVVRTSTLAEADRWHLTQTLIGDTIDGYQGCPGVGKVTVDELFDGDLRWEPQEHTLLRGKRKGEKVTKWVQVPSETPWDTVVSCFEKAGLTEDDALVQARVARILRYEDWDSEKKEPILWQPKQATTMLKAT